MSVNSSQRTLLLVNGGDDSGAPRSAAFSSASLKAKDNDVAKAGSADAVASPKSEGGGSSSVRTTDNFHGRVVGEETCCGLAPEPKCRVLILYVACGVLVISAVVAALSASLTPPLCTVGCVF